MSSELSIEIKEGKIPSIKIIKPVGELDEYDLDELRKDIDPILADKNINIIIFDLSDLEFINSKGIGYLVSVHTHLSKDQRKLVFVDAQEVVMDVISLVGLTSIIPYFTTLDEAYDNLIDQ